MACIPWKMNHDFREGITIHEAIRLAENGFDMGVRGCLMLKPTDINDVPGHIMWEGYLLSFLDNLPPDLYRQ